MGKGFLSALLGVLLAVHPVLAGELHVAAASNFIGPLEQIRKGYESSSGIRIMPSYSSTGRLYGQILKKAPYDLFLAADAIRPEGLFQQGLCREPVVYAKGRAIAWSRKKELVAFEQWQEVVKHPSTKVIAIPKPEVAPYGEVARKALQREGLWKNVESRIVYGQNVAQSFQYGEQGMADLVFTSLSYGMSDLGRQGRVWKLSGDDLVVQQACVISGGREEEAQRFLAYLQSPDVAELLTQFGYE